MRLGGGGGSPRAAGPPGNGSRWRGAAEDGSSPSPEAWSGAPNGSAGDWDPFGRDEELAKLEIAVLAVTFAVAVLGNGSVLLALRRTPRKASRMHLFIRHLSLADLVVAFFQVLPQLCWEVTHRFHGPDGLCRVVKHLQVFGMFASAYMLVAMTADRYIAVCHPLKTLQQPTKRSYAMIAAAWALSLLLSTPQYFIFSLSEVERGSRVYDCWAHFIMPWGPRAYITWITGGIFVAPVLILATCYGFICFRIWRSARGRARPGEAAGGGPRRGLLLAPCVSGVKTISRAKIRTVKMTFVIVSAYVVCWAPFFTIQMWSVWDQHFPWVGRCPVGVRERRRGSGRISASPPEHVGAGAPLLQGRSGPEGFPEGTAQPGGGCRRVCCRCWNVRTVASAGVSGEHAAPTPRRICILCSLIAWLSTS